VVLGNLRPWRAADVGAVEAIRSDPVVGRWSRLPDEDAAAWIERQRTRSDGVSLAITQPGADDAAVGKVALGHHDPGAHRAELSYWLLPSQRGSGLASAACRALCLWGFDDMGLATILLDIEVDNEPSRRVAAALGATPGALHDETDRAGVVRRLVTYSLAR
jgi:RimJ/RimL family protein N-acetyltransferase